MPEEPTIRNLRVLWRGQPTEKPLSGPEELVSRRSRVLSSVTNSEIGITLGAALLFVALIALRFASAGSRIGLLALSAAIAVIAGSSLSLYRFLTRSWRKDPPQALLAA
jgi:hypothetical protein